MSTNAKLAALAFEFVCLVLALAAFATAPSFGIAALVIAIGVLACITADA